RPVRIDLERHGDDDLAAGRGAEAAQLDLPEVRVLAELRVLALRHADAHGGLHVTPGREPARALAGDLRVARDDRVRVTTRRLDDERAGGHVDEDRRGEAEVLRRERRAGAQLVVAARRQ